MLNALLGQVIVLIILLEVYPVEYGMDHCQRLDVAIIPRGEPDSLVFLFRG